MMKKKKWLFLPATGIIAALSAGFLSCCSLPMLAGIILGIASGLGISMGLAKGLLLSTLITIPLLIPIVYYHLQKKKKVLSAASCVCPPERRPYTRLFLQGFLLAGIPLLIMLVFSSLSNGLAQKAQVPLNNGATLFKVSLPVYGMTCEACGKIILNQFETLRKIESYEADISEESIQFSFKGKNGDLELLIAKIHEMGLTTGTPEIE